MTNLARFTTGHTIVSCRLLRTRRARGLAFVILACLLSTIGSSVSSASSDTCILNSKAFFVGVTSPADASITGNHGVGTIQSGSCGTYVWNGSGAPANTLWTNPLNWTPARITPSSCNVLVFDGSSTPSPTVTGIPTETVMGIHFINGVAPTLNADTVMAGTKTLTILGSSADLLVDAGSILTLANSTPLHLALTSNATGSVAGQILLQGGAHQLLTSAGSTVTFTGANAFTTDSTYDASTHPFGNGDGTNDDSIIFNSGAVYFHNNGVSPFGSGSNHVAKFNSGSEARFLTNTGFEANGRTYANLTIGDASTKVTAKDPCADVPGTCTGNFTFDNLTINSPPTDSSSLQYVGSSAGTTVTIKGGINSTGAGALVFRTAPDVLLAGGSTGGVVIDGGTPITFGNDGTNAAAVLFESKATVNSGTSLTLGRVVQMSLFANETLTVNGEMIGGPNGYVIGFLQKNFDGLNLTRNFEIGIIGFYDPVAVTFSGITTPGSVTAKAKDGDIADAAIPVITSKSVNANWTLTNGGVAFSNYSATFNYSASQIDAGANVGNFIVGKRDGGVWTTPSVSGPSAISITATGMTSMSDFAVGESPNRPPSVTNPGTQNSAENDIVSLQIQASDPDNNTLSYSATGLPAGLSINSSTGLISGTIAFGASPTNDASVTVSDGTLSDTANFAWTVSHVNVAPVANNQNVETAQDTATPLTLTATDANGSALTYSLVTQPTHGTLSGIAPNLTYTPALDYSGGDSFTFKANDGQLDSNVATVTIAVTPAKITFRSASFAQNVSAGSITINKPAGASANDVMVASIALGGQETITPPSGWSRARDPQTSTALDFISGTLHQVIYYKVAAPGEPASYTWTFSAKQNATGGIAAYSGVDTTAPIDVGAGQSNVSSTAINAPSVTTRVADTRVVGLFAVAANASITPPARMSERGEVASGKVKVATEIADVNWPAIANTGLRTATASSAAVNVGQILALRPSSASPQQPPAPASLNATAENAVVALSWSSSAGADTYNVYRSTTTGGPYNSPIASGLTSITYNDPTVTNGTTYFYVVRAVNAAGESANSPEASATPNGCAGVNIVVSPTSLPSGTVGVSYSQTITAAGGAAAYTFSLVSGSLPPGVSLASSGLLSGNPKNGAGGKTYNPTIRATDAHGCTGSRAYTLAISK